MAGDPGTGASPTTVGAVDIGSNAIRMVVAEVSPEGETRVLERTSRPIRLGHDTFVTGKLSQQTMAAAITILRDYRRILDTYQTDVVRAVATSAVREASNRDAFLDRLSTVVGLDVDVIEPTEQSRLIVSAVLEAVEGHLDLENSIALIVEVGGGSVLLTVLRGGEITASQSLNLGSIRMQEMLSTAQEPAERAADLLRQHIAQSVELARRELDLPTVQVFIGIGGDARFAGHQVGEEIEEGELMVVEAAQFDGLVASCSPHPPEELNRLHGLPFADAETLVPALLVYQALLHATQARELVVSRVSMRDGLLLDLPRFIRGEQDPLVTESMIRSAKTLGTKFNYDAKHAEHVAGLAVKLFDFLSSEHRLSNRHRLLLQVAAILHDVGTFVSTRAHHKHGHYLITNSEIFGLRRDDLVTVAHVARYHRRAMPKPSHLDYVALPRDQRMVINKLAAILRVADALDRGHWQQVRDVEFERRGRDVVVIVHGVADLTLERRAMAVKGDMFEEIFGLAVRLEEAPASAPVPGEGLK